KFLYREFKFTSPILMQYM
ncbi:hypothetical protein, partial [Plasmodium yoelii yoelii]